MTQKTSDFVRSDGTYRIADALDAADLARANAQSDGATQVFRYFLSAMMPTRLLHSAKTII